MPIDARAMKDLRGFMTIDQVRQMIKSCDNLRDRVLIQVLFVTGMRVSEMVKPTKGSNPVLGLRTDNVIWEENALIIRHAKRKDNPPRRINVDVSTLQLLREYLEKRPEKSDYVMPVGRQMAYNIVREAAERIGIMEVGDPLVSKRRHPHPHHLRHSLAVHSVRISKGNYADLIRLQEQLGHSSVSTTASYVQFSDEEQRKWYDGLWEAEEEPVEEA